VRRASACGISTARIGIGDVAMESMVFVVYIYLCKPSLRHCCIWTYSGRLGIHMEQKSSSGSPMGWIMDAHVGSYGVDVDVTAV
jgi:hypothetical protein